MIWSYWVACFPYLLSDEALAIREELGLIRILSNFSSWRSLAKVNLDLWDERLQNGNNLMVQCDEAAFFKPLKPLKKARHWCAVHLCRLYRKCLSEALFDRVTSIAFLEVLFPWDLVNIYFLVCWEAGIYQLVQDIQWTN
jgi:hypothetical protein